MVSELYVNAITYTCLEFDALLVFLISWKLREKELHYIQ